MAVDARRYVRHYRRDRLKPGLSLWGRLKRKQGTRFFNRVGWWKLVGFFCAGVAMAGVSATWLLPVFGDWLNRPVSKVEVRAPFFHVSRQELQSLLLPCVQTSFFSLNTQAIAALLQHDGRVSRASVRRVWPARLLVQVEEEVPVAHWQDDRLVNARGEVLDFGSRGSPGTLPLLYGPDGSQEDVMQQYLSLEKSMRPLGLAVAGVSLTETGSWSFRVGKVVVRLGNEQLRRRLRRFIRLYEVSLKDVWIRIRSVDLRYRDGAAVRWLRTDEMTVRTSDTEKNRL